MAAISPMPVKYWSSAGLILTHWCSARCACCYLCCSGEALDHERPDMTVESALAMWEGLAATSPHGCRVHLTGGEPFGDWPRLIEICRRAKRGGLARLEKVETNGYWADDPPVIRDRVKALDDAGMGKLSISADPYHQQFVPVEKVRVLARVADEALGPQRVQVRWRDWLADGFDTHALSSSERGNLFVRYAAKKRDRLCGRAAAAIAPGLELRPAEAFAGSTCREALLRSRHVHIDGGGHVMPGACAGLCLGAAGSAADVGQLWRRLAEDYASREILGPLVQHGPLGLLGRAGQLGYVQRTGYAGKCHLCWDIRRFLSSAMPEAWELRPLGIYGKEAD